MDLKKLLIFQRLIYKEQTVKEILVFSWMKLPIAFSGNGQFYFQEKTISPPFISTVIRSPSFTDPSRIFMARGSWM